MDLWLVLMAAVLFLIFRFCVSQKAIRSFLDTEHDKLKSFTKRIKKEHKECQNMPIGSEEFIEDRDRELGYLTRSVGHIEFAFFGILVFLLFQNKLPILSAATMFFTFFGGWLAIKTVVSYDQWSHKIVGKAYYYVSLLGMLFNIFFASLFGISLHYMMVWILKL